ncbi:TPA: hypothetical protein SMT61_000679 [Proteus mirabilis]|uniref:tail fiber/spike domain-containing protein n=1 Tax=unclassified Proteus (in: enterobacteria) TaxID=257482 RepID=UPI001378599E|nr:hypothetical protein [Proteus sp. G4406]NBN27781.1 hypothetical protein [Proteus sp. G4408]HEK1156718.1 hypothetical protein [Proteus mirabilis]HEK2777768.1 hypothetical protein [Proteus mirabilis]
MSTIPTQNPVPSEAPRDLKYNSGKVDEFVTSMKNKYIDRFGQEHFTIEGLRWVAQQAISQFGYITLDSFQKGAEITLPNQVLRDETTREYYRWDGALPKSVPVDSTPDSSGGVGIGKWISVGDASLRWDLSRPDGGKYIGFGDEHTVDDLRSVIKDEVDSHYLPTPFYLSNKETLNNTLKIATFNTWVDGSVNQYYGGDYTSKFRLMDLYYELIKSGCDFCGMQECYSFPQNPASDFIIKPFKDAFFGCANYIGREWFYGNISVSRYPYKEKQNVVYSVEPNNIDNGHRAYTRIVIEKNGINISIYNTHLSLDWSLAESMRDELIRAVQSDVNSHIVVVGDFNRDDAVFFAPFIAAGFIRSNNNQYNTNNRDGVWFIDDILYKGFSSKLTAGIQETPYKLSDHKLFYVELSL